MIQIKSIKGGVLLLEIDRANLRRANLRRADLSGADLSEANLRRANLPIGRCKWVVRYTLGGVVRIGCKSKTIEEWEVWFSGGDEFVTKRNTPEFEAIYKSYLMAKYAIEIGFY